jgi:hypothetical protein
MNDEGRAGAVTPKQRFQLMQIAIELGEEKNILMRFVREMLSGERDPVVSGYFGAFVSLGADASISYPLCYVKEIFKKLKMHAAINEILKIMNKLESHLRSKHSGLAWECN